MAEGWHDGAGTPHAEAVALAVAGACLVLLWALNSKEVWRTSIYAVVGAVLWVAAVESGVHPTIAGMLAGLLISARPPSSSTNARSSHGL